MRVCKRASAWRRVAGWRLTDTLVDFVAPASRLNLRPRVKRKIALDKPAEEVPLLSKSGETLHLARPDVRAEDIAAVVEVLRSSHLALGPRVTAFERALADRVGLAHAAATSSGTAALHVLIRALDIGCGDEVITTPFSFVASTNCILQEGATPVFVDIRPDTLCIDAKQVEDAITPRTKAVLGVDVFGHPADWPTLESIAERHDLLLIEDSAESLGSTLCGRQCGSFGHAAVFGFHPNKQITTGEGGAVVTSDARLAELCRSLANQGRADVAWLHHVRLGYNYRLDEMSAALGLSQLNRLEEIVHRRACAAALYLEALSRFPDLVLPYVAPSVGMSWFVFVVRLTSSYGRADRDHLLRALQAQGIGCRDYFPPIHLQPFVRKALGTRPGQFPVAECASDRSLALPFYSGLSAADVSRVACAIRGSLGSA